MSAAAETGAEGRLSEPKVVTFGCRLNAYESEVIARQARAAGLAEAVIVNSCAVTAEAERQVRQAIRRARREHPGAQVIVAGCAAQLDPHGYAAMAEVDRVIGNEAKLRAESYRPGPSIVVDDVMRAEETASHLLPAFASRTRAFVEVQQGCDHRCTFCIIPFARGRNRSVPVGEVVQQVRTLVEGGVREVVLTGVDITDYGRDLPGRPTLGQLARRVLALVPGLPRLRLSSLDPVEVDDEVLRLLAEEPRLMPHLHLSLQAGSDMILKRMKRRHTMADALRLAERARAARPDVALGADLIAGFPTEDEAMFAETLAAVEALGLTTLHVFPYSARPGTPAARMPQVAKAVRKDRARRLRAAGAAALARFLESRVGMSERVLVEEAAGDGTRKGRSEHFAPVRLDAGRPGEVVRARVAAADGERLLARVTA